MGRPARKKGAIERSALELFVEKGVDGTSIRDIAERAGVTEGALYRHHASKHDLVKALFLMNYEGFAEIIKKVQENDGTFDAIVGQLVREFFELYDADHYVFQYILVTRHFLLDEVRNDDKNPVELLLKLVKKAQTKGEIPKVDADLVTQMMIGVVIQTALAARFGRVKTPLVKQADMVSRACLAIANLGKK